VSHCYFSITNGKEVVHRLFTSGILRIPKGATKMTTQLKEHIDSVWR